MQFQIIDVLKFEYTCSYNIKCIIIFGLYFPHTITNATITAKNRKGFGGYVYMNCVLLPRRLSKYFVYQAIFRRKNLVPTPLGTRDLDIVNYSRFVRRNQHRYALHIPYGTYRVSI